MPDEPIAQVTAMVPPPVVQIVAHTDPAQSVRLAAIEPHMAVSYSGAATGAL